MADVKEFVPSKGCFSRLFHLLFTVNQQERVVT